jgi:hypothetical protein
MSDEPSDYYAKLYLKGINHVEVDHKDADMILKDKIMILGNGKSRLKPSVQKIISKWRYGIWVCNLAYQEKNDIENITAVGCKEKEIIQKALQFKKDNVYDYEVFILDNKNIEESSDEKLYYFKEQRNWSTGALLLLEAVYQEFGEIILAGFDFDNTNIYNNNEENGELFKKQFLSISKEFGIKNISFLGKQPEFLI